MIVQVLFTTCVILNTIHTITEIKTRKVEGNSDRTEFVLHPSDNSDRCTAYSESDIFRFVMTKTCPLNYNSACSNSLFDPQRAFEYRCQFPISQHEVMLTNSTGLLDMLKLRDPKRRDWCMIAMFYSHNCPYSAQLAPHFNKIPIVYNNLLAVAVDATDFTKLNFRYGITGTPTVLLWVNGIGVARMPNNFLNSSDLNEFIARHTDLVPLIKLRPPNVIFENAKISVLQDSEFGTLEVVQIKMTSSPGLSALYTFTCFLVCVAAILYQFRDRYMMSQDVCHWIQSHVGARYCEEIYYLLYLNPPQLINENIVNLDDLEPEPEELAEEDEEEVHEEQGENIEEQSPLADLPPLVVD